MIITRRHVITTVVVAALVAAVAAAGTVLGARSDRDDARHFCAYFADTVGLYVDNPVTQMGYPIGKVSGIDAHGTRVRVDFSLDVDRSIPTDVKAVIRSKSLLADRSLELVGNYHSGPKLSASDCIPMEQTATPKSLSEITGSAADFLAALTPDHTRSVADAVTGIDSALQGQGADLQSLFVHAQGAMSNPDQMVADVGSIITDFAPFSTTTLDNWSTGKQMLKVMPTDLAVGAHGLWDGVTAFIYGLAPLLADLYDAQAHYGDDINTILGYASVGLKLAATRSDDLKSLLSTIPSIADQLKTVDGTTRLQISPPQLDLRAADPATLCAAVNKVRPYSCRPDGGRVRLSDLRILDAVLAGVR